MSFSTALSGLNAAANNLAVTGNNIANANTTGFKKSRSEFADMYASAMAGISKTQPGMGVKIAEVAQQFNQGNLESTENSLDMAISGEGFFTLRKDPADTASATVYSRAGAFKVNKDGVVVNSAGQALLAYVPIGGGLFGGVPDKVYLGTGVSPPVATTQVDLRVNLNSDSVVPATTTFVPSDPTSYNNQTSATIYDSLGASHQLTTYFRATSTPGTWDAFHYIDGNSAPVSANPSTALTFDTDGNLTSGGAIALDAYTLPGSSAAPLAATLDYTGSTQLAADFGVDALQQDGLAAGQLTGISIDSSGVISAKYSNDAMTPLGQVALTRFINPQGLIKLGDTNWAQSISSGLPVTGVAGTGSFGGIQSMALEQSNVDLSAQLTNLIIAQQAYQANAQTISTENTIMQTLLNI
ncbi:MAG: flagellar hook protein FlgE [Methylovulum sp.]|nr:flagellar hook protein FlgE [Methylovulum sp.]